METKKQIKYLNTLLTDVILDSVQGKKRVLCTLSGGMDTRVIFSILLKNDVAFNTLTWWATPEDMAIAKRISEYYKIKQFCVYFSPYEKHELWKKMINVVCSEHDIIIYGELMSEVFNKFVRLTDPEEHLNNIIHNFKVRVKKNADNEMKNKFFPCLDPFVMNVVDNIPIIYRRYGYINRELIRLNCPHLLRIPHTVVNLRYRLIETMYHLSLPFIEMRKQNV